MKALPQEETKPLRKIAESGVVSGEKISKLVKGEPLNNEAIKLGNNYQLPTAGSGMKSNIEISDTTVDTKTTDKVRLGLEGSTKPVISSTTTKRIGGAESNPEMSIEAPLVADDCIPNNHPSENNVKLNESPNSISTSTDNQIPSSITHQQLFVVSERQLNELENEVNSSTNQFIKIDDTSENISGLKQPGIVHQSTENLINNHTKNMVLTGKGKSFSNNDVTLTLIHKSQVKSKFRKM